MKTRIQKRGGESEAALKVRLANAEREIAECLELKQVIRQRVVNDDLTTASQTFVALVEALYGQELGLVKARGDEELIGNL